MAARPVAGLKGRAGGKGWFGMLTQLPKKKYTNRPQRFRVNPEHTFAQGLVFAGLGNTPDSLYYHDSSVDRNHGALTNMSPSGWVDDTYLCRRVMQFAGGFAGGETGEHVAAPYPLPPADDNLSVLLWAKPRGVMVRQGIIGDDTNLQNWGIGCWSNLGELRCYSGSPDTRWIGNPGDLESDVWNHYAFLWENASWRVYKNGIELTPSENNAATGSGVPTQLLIGHIIWTFPTWSYFDGWIADPMIYDHAIELDELFQLAERGNVMLSGLIEPLRGAPSYFFYEAPPTNIRLLHTPKKKRTTRPYRFKLNDNHPLSEGVLYAFLGNCGEANYFHDSGPFATHSIPDSSQYRGWAFAPKGRRAAVFEDVQGQGVVVPDGKYPVGPFTVVSWVRIDNQIQDLAHVAFAGTVLPHVGPMFGPNYYPICYLGLNNFRYFEQTIPIGEWHHLAIMCPGTTQNDILSASCYIDGEPVSAGFTVNSGPQDARGALYFGRSSNRYMDGGLADCIVYDRVLSQSEVIIHANDSDPMLSGLIEPLRDPPSYFFTQPTPTEAITGIFEPLVIGV